MLRKESWFSFPAGLQETCRNPGLCAAVSSPQHLCLGDVLLWLEQEPSPSSYISPCWDRDQKTGLRPESEITGIVLILERLEPAAGVVFLQSRHSLGQSHGL